MKFGQRMISLVISAMWCYWAAQVMADSAIGLKPLAVPLSNLTTNQKSGWTVSYGGYSHLNLTMNQISTVDITINNIDGASWGDSYEFHVKSKHPALLHVDRIIKANEIGIGNTEWRGNVTIEAIFLGETQLFVELHRGVNIEPEHSNEFIRVVITRALGLMDDLYRLSVGTLVFILYINFGAVLDLYALKRIILRPIGPAIGFVGQFLLVPNLSYLIGYWVFPEQIELRLGMLFMGSGPAGGFSNVFTVMLNGNINLSVTMTAFSNLAAFGMMPLWIFTLGNKILEGGNFAIPYGTIAMLSFSLVVPLSMGIAMQKYAKGFTERIEKHLQTISFALILFVMGFAFTINSYMFTILSWDIIVACASLPWIGYLIGYTLAKIFHQNPADCVTIAIETGIQNTGVAIFMLNYTLPQPQADITSAIPVTNFLLTPIPLIILYLVRKMCFRPTLEELEMEQVPTKDPVEEVAMMEKADIERRASLAQYKS